MMELGKIILQATKQVNQIPEGQKTDVISGTIQTINPLTIKISDKLTISESNLILSAFVRETWINIPTHENYNHVHEINVETEVGGDGHTHMISAKFTDPALPKILLWRGLAVGDVVYMLRVGQGQTYFVLQRIEGITNEEQ